MAYYGFVAQGDTSSASDCRVAYNELSSKYNSANVQIAGFSTSSDTPLSNRANQSNFINAKDYHVLYWSSHGNSTPALNVINGPYFESYTTAYNNWRNTGNTLKVPIFAACYQFDGDTNRHRWANNIMRHSDIRAMCGYHESAPSSTDATIAQKFFDYCCEGSTGNSVMYSWKNANATTSGGSSYIVLVYYDNNRCYYRLPGFSTTTYDDPNRSTTKIYRYTRANPNGAEVPKTLSLSINSAPYSLTPTSNSCKMLNVSKWNPKQTIRVGQNENAFFYGLREYSMKPVSSEQGRAYNIELLQDLVGGEMLASASLNIYDDAMAEVHQDDLPEKDITIGSTTQVFQQYNGIILEENCIAACSDATGVISLTNQWQEYTISKNVDHIDLLNTELPVFNSFFKEELSKSEGKLTIKSVTPIYIRIHDKYNLHYDVKFSNGQCSMVDAKQLSR